MSGRAGLVVVALVFLPLTAGPAAASPTAAAPIQSVVGSGLCDGLPATDVSISPFSLALDPQDRIAFLESGGGKLTAVRTVLDGRVQTLAYQPPYTSPYPPFAPEGDDPRASRDGVPRELPAIPEIGLVTGQALAIDRAGTVLVADRDANAIVAVDGRVAARLLGVADPEATSDGANGPAAGMPLGEPLGVTVDVTGSWYVVEQLTGGARKGAVVIRFVNRTDEPRVFAPGTAAAVVAPPGHIVTVAGGGEDTGDGVPAHTADLGRIGRVAIDPAGALFFATQAQVRAVNLSGTTVTRNGVTIPAGMVQTVAGSGEEGPSRDGMPARLASLDLRFSQAVAVDRDGNLYFPQLARSRISRVDPAGTLTTFVGHAPREPYQAVYSTVMDHDYGEYTPPGRHRSETAVGGPQDVAVGGDGRTLYYAARYEFAIRAVDADGTVRQVAGNSLWRYCGDGRSAAGTGALAEPQMHTYNPSSGTSAVEGPDGAVYIAEYGNNVVRRVDRTGILSTAVGTPAPCTVGPGLSTTPPLCPGSSAGDGGVASDATVDRPHSLAADGHGLFIAEVGGQRVRYVNLSDKPVRALGVEVAAGAIERVVGGAGACPPSDSYNLAALQEGLVAARDACISPWTIAAGRDGDLFVSDYGRQAVYRVDRTGGLRLVAGRSADDGFDLLGAEPAGVAPYGCYDDEGPGRSGQLCGPSGLAVDERGNLYIGQYGQSFAGLGWPRGRVDYVNLSDDLVTVHGVTVAPGQRRRVAGIDADTYACPPSSPDGGRALDAQTCSLRGVAFAEGRLYLSDSWNARVRMVDEAGVITTIAGAGTPLPASGTARPSWGAYAGDGGEALQARLSLPGQLSFTAAGGLLVLDAGNHRVRLIGG